MFPGQHAKQLIILSKHGETTTPKRQGKFFIDTFYLIVDNYYSVQLYLTCTEWSNVYGGRRPDQRSRDEVAQKIARLPFDHCSLSLQPISEPVCNEEGYTFEKDHIYKFIEKFHCDPITGKTPFDHKNVITLRLFKNQEGQYHCPVLFKPFNENSKIVCIKKTGNVFLYEAIEELNLKTKNFRDLLNDEPFVRKDLIIIQDPADGSKINPSQYYHFLKNLKWAEDEEEDRGEQGAQIKKMDYITKSTLAELATTYEPSGSISSSIIGENKKSAKVDKFNAAHYSTGRAAASLTSTVMHTYTKTEVAALSDETVRYSRVKKNGFVQLDTSLGSLNLELYCIWVPKACENFFGLARRGYYNGTIFHRLIKNFMVQGGDPTGTGSGGGSIWGPPFPDDFHQHLSHDTRGVLSMANSGPNTNKSQFFITFRPCKHLDKKHTIFGRVVGGMFFNIPHWHFSPN